MYDSKKMLERQEPHSLPYSRPGDLHGGYEPHPGSHHGRPYVSPSSSMTK